MELWYRNFDAESRVSNELVEMLNLCLYHWRRVAASNDEFKENAISTALELIDALEDACQNVTDHDHRLYAATPKTYSMLVNVLSEHPKSSTACNDVVTILEKGNLQGMVFDLLFYNSVLHALAKFSLYHAVAPDMAERVFQRLCSETSDMSPDTATFVCLLRAWANSTMDDAPERTQAVLETMIRKHPELVDEKCFNVCIDAWAKVGNPERAEELLWRMETTPSGRNIQPTAASFDSALVAWSKSHLPEAATRAERLLEQMERYYGCVPTPVSLASVLQARSKSSDPGMQVQRLLDRFEELYSEGSLCSPPNKICYLRAIQAWSRSTGSRHTNLSPPEEAGRLVHRMKKISIQDNARRDLAPCVIIYTAWIQVWAKSDLSVAPDRALEIYRQMQQESATGRVECRPNTTTLNALLDAFCRKGRMDEAHELISDRQQGVTPDLASYHILLKAFIDDASALSMETAERAEEVLRHLETSCRCDSQLQPTVLTYSLVIKAWGNASTTDGAERAQAVLLKMLREDGTQVLPDTSILNQVLEIWATSTEGGAADQAETLLARTKEVLPPDPTTHLHMIRAWARSGRRQGPRRAEEHLEDAKQLIRSNRTFDDTQKLTSAHFNGVMEAHARAGEPSSLDSVEKLIEDMRLWKRQGHQTSPDQWSLHNYVMTVLVSCSTDMAPKQAMAILNELLRDGISPAPRIINKLQEASLRGNRVASQLLSALD